MSQWDSAWESVCSTRPYVEVRFNSTIWETLTPCFSFVLLPLVSDMVLAPLCALIVLLSGRLAVTTAVRLEWNRVSVLKFAIAGLHAAVAVGHCGYAFGISGNRRLLLENSSNAVCNIVFSLSVLVAYALCVHDGVASSGWLHFTWFVRLLLLLPGFISLIGGGQTHWIFMEKEPFLCLLIVHTFYFCVALLMVGVLCASDGQSARYTPLHASQKEVCPESCSSAVSVLFMWFANPLITKGLRRTDLSIDDLWALETSNRAGHLLARYERTAGRRNIATVNGADDNAPYTVWSLFRRLAYVTRADIFASIIIVVALSFIRFGSVIFMKLIVDGVTAKLPLWYSLTVLVLMILFDLTVNVLYAKRDFVSSKSYMNVRSILIAEISNKIMRLSSGAKTRFSCGEVINVVSTDVNRICMFWFHLRDFVYCPLMLVMGFSGLFYVIGWNSCYGIVVLCTVIVFNYYVSSRMAHYEHLQMEFKDCRLKLVNDILSGVRVLKLYAWEPSMEEMVAEIRAKEVATLRIVFILDGLITVSFQFGPILAIFLSFYGYVVLDGNPLTPEVAFMSIMFFMMLRYAIYQLPQVITSAVKALISGRRIVRLFNEQEQQRSYIERIDPPADRLDVVHFDNCSFSWDNSLTSGAASSILNLRNISLSVRRGELIGVVGRVGAGKSSLLSAVVGEIECVYRDAAAVYAKSIGYVPQQAWIQNKTLKSNILLENHLKENLYRRTIEACALLDDLKLLKAGDLTEIGEKGINLSGGQKARVSLARAAYQQADLYVLDDVLSAVDSHVGAHIFEKVIGPKGMLRNTTRIFALNSLAFLKDCDRIVVMNDGTIDDIDTFERLVEKNSGPFAELMREYIEKQSKKRETVYLDGEPEPSDDALVEEIVQTAALDSQASLATSVDSVAGGLKVAGGPSATTTNVIRHRLLSQVSASSCRRHDFESTVSSSVMTVNNAPSLPSGMIVESASSDLEMGRLVETERRAEGIVDRHVYTIYVHVFGVWMCTGFFVTMFGGSLFGSFANVWLARWSSNAKAVNASSTLLAASTTDLSPTESLLVYGFFGFSNSVFICLSTIFLAIGAYYASISFHSKLIHSLLRSPIAFFDKTPLGRIINRLSSDIDRIDENVPWSISFAFILLADAFHSIASIVMVIPWSILVVIPLFICFMSTTYHFNKASVQFRRIASTSWSKCVSLVQDVYIGADSIRVYDVVRAFAERINFVIDYNGEGTYIEFVANRWIQIQMDIITQIAVFLFILMAILLGSWQMITIGAVALFSGFLGEISRNWREAEVQMVGVERVQEYIDNEHEAPWRLTDPGRTPPPRQWPVAGRVVFDHFSFRYRPECDYVLKDLCLDIAGGTRVGIVGRTGAGKSSITMALFRVVEPAGGAILIDDIDITHVGLHDLREVLTIIPQDPVLFCGSLRSNLDPFEIYTDVDIHNALEKANLREFVEGLERGLKYEIAEGGSNLSLGQRQLVCLARALLRKTTRILVLDEATAAVDPETDRLIQLSIRQYFQHCTVLTIAHRLNTILDYDRILVMHAGRAAEFDTPLALLNRPDSLFTSLVRHAGMSRKSAIEAIRDNRVMLLASDETQKTIDRSRLYSTLATSSAQQELLDLMCTRTPPHIDPEPIRAQVAAADGLLPPLDENKGGESTTSSISTSGSIQRLPKDAKSDEE